jgi:glycerophosphoryl diester phosphodiesterase
MNISAPILFFYFFIGAHFIHAQITLKTLLADSSKRVLVAAHRGDWKNYPENSIPAVLSCIRSGIDIVEVDVQETRDGRFVLMHDISVNRTTNGKGKVSNLNFADISKLKLRDRFNKLTDYSVPTLDTILQITRGKIIVNIDKSAGRFDKLIPIIKKYNCGSNIILKGTGSYAFFNNYNRKNDDSICFMPVFNARNSSIDSFLIQTATPLVELLLSNDSSYAVRPEGLAMFRMNNCKIWYNALFESISGGHNESKNALESWDWFIDHDAYIIQTDFPFHLMSYLVSKGLRNHDPKFEFISLQDLPKINSKMGAVNGGKIRSNSKESQVKLINPDSTEKAPFFYTVKKGDTLSEISEKQGVSMDALLSLNPNLNKDYKIVAGQKIRIR